MSLLFPSFYLSCIIFNVNRAESHVLASRGQHELKAFNMELPVAHRVFLHHFVV